MIALLLLACNATNPAREAIDASRVTPAAGWSCPMHPTVTADGPGACSECGMPLTEGR